MSWAVVVPVKGGTGAKSRLGALPHRSALAEAFALDTVTALRGCPSIRRVTAVTSDAGLAARLRDLDVDVVQEPAGSSPTDSLNTAIRAGIDATRRAEPGCGLLIATGDLPALTSSAVEQVLTRSAGHPRTMVPDAQGSGTTALLTLAGVTVRPCFGPGSRAAHEAAGHRPVEASAGMRRDVDTPADLDAAIRLGVGPHTLALI